MTIIDYYDDLGQWQPASAKREREHEGEDDRLDILEPVGYPKADMDLSANRVPTGLSGRYGSTRLSCVAWSGAIVGCWVADRALSATRSRQYTTFTILAIQMLHLHLIIIKKNII